MKRRILLKHFLNNTILGHVTSARVSGTPTGDSDDSCGDSTALIDLDTG